MHVSTVACDLSDPRSCSEFTSRVSLVSAALDQPRAIRIGHDDQSAPASVAHPAEMGTHGVAQTVVPV